MTTLKMEARFKKSNIKYTYCVVNGRNKCKVVVYGRSTTSHDSMTAAYKHYFGN